MIKAAQSKNSSTCTKNNHSSSSSYIKSQKKSELVTDTIISNATQLWIKTPVHLRNPLQFLQLSSHCINDSVYLSNLSDIKEKVYLMNCSIISPIQQQHCNNLITNSIQEHQNSNCWSHTQSQQQTQQQQHQHSTQQQSHLQSELTDLSFSVNFIDHHQQSIQIDYSTCSLGQEFMLTQAQSESLDRMGETTDNHVYSCFNSCNDIANQPISLQQMSSISSSPVSSLTTSSSSPPSSSSSSSSVPQHQQQIPSQINHPLLSSNPPPLAFFPHVKRLPCKRRLPILSEPPPLVPIQSKTQCKKT